jgi:2,5-diamino-6-(ribosylamino)-4(3H)-pyrimidinone 5'-phosphate reductase
MVFINAAMSVDGKISSTERAQLKISDEEDLERVDRMRAAVDAIVIGGKTLLNDNPRLTIRSESLRREREKKGFEKDPIKVVVTGSCNVPLDSSFLLEGNGQKFVFTTKRAVPEDLEVLSSVSKVFVVGEDRVDFHRMLDILARHDVKRVMVEGGATLNFEMIEARVVDEIHVTVSPYIIGGKAAPTLVDGKGFTGDRIKGLDLISCERSGGSLLVKYRLQYNDVKETPRIPGKQFELKESGS